MTAATVIIPNWNGRHLLEQCLKSLAGQTFSDFRTIVVDNGSTDGSVAWVQEHHPEVRLIVNSQNRGFAAAINQGIRAGQGAYVLTLNNDAWAEPGWVAALIAAAESDPTVGMCASKMLFAGRPGIINSTGIALDKAGIAWDRRGGEADTASETVPVEVFGPCGGAALYRRAMLDQIGLFDEDFFAYLEDVDLAWRARRAGWRCLYVPAARVFHRHSATGREGSPFKSYHLGRNKVWLLAKNYPIGHLWPYLPLVFLYDLAAVAYAAVARRDLHALAGRLAGWGGLPRMLRKRERAPEGARTDLGCLAPPDLPWRVQHRYQHLAIL